MGYKTALILSDVHYGDLAHLDSFGKNGPSSDDDLKLIARGIVDRLSYENQSVDLILVLGDLTSKGSPGEFQDVDRFLSILRNIIGLNENDVFITYGNHDVDWNICRIMSEPQEYHSAYCLAAANIGGLFVSPGHYTFYGPVVGSGVAHLEGIDLISLNSGIECYDDQNIKHGKFGAAQFEWLKNELPSHLRGDSTKIVILHHHLSPLPYAIPILDLSALEEGSNTLDLLGSYGVDLVLHGHRHHPIAHTAAKTNWKKPITFFCAGSFGVAAKERANGRLPNTMHTVRINMFSGGQNFEGLIQSFELDSSAEWVPLRENDNEYPLNQKQWVGAADAAQRTTKEIESIIADAVHGLVAESYSPFPSYERLPLSLRCITHADLNKSIQNEASKVGLQVTGEYPKTCMATKVKP